MLAKPGHDSLKRLTAHQLRNRLPVFDQDKNWDPSHPEPGCQDGVFLSVDLHHCCLPSQLFCDISHHRCE
jgi:hypothetical protein